MKFKDLYELSTKITAMDISDLLLEHRCAILESEFFSQKVSILYDEIWQRLNQINLSIKED